jgi:hypothetical protein
LDQVDLVDSYRYYLLTYFTSKGQDFHGHFTGYPISAVGGEG